jgi:hypothetical protein
VLVSNDIDIPDKCPENCPEFAKPFDQGNLCTYCPIFNCSEHLIPEELGGKDSYFRMLEPKDYRLDWAIEFRKWFKSDMRGIPTLRLRQR